MKRWIVLLPLLVALCQTAGAAPLPETVQEQLPAPAEELWEELGEDDADHHTFAQGIALLWDKACDFAGDVVHESLRGAVVLMAVVLLCAVAQDCLEAADSGSIPNFVPVAGAMAITLVAAGNLQSMIGLGVETIEDLNICSKALLPALAAAVASSGGVVTAGVRQVAAVFFADVLMTLIHHVLLPLVYLCIVAAAAHAMLPGQRIGMIGKTITKGVTWLLTGLLILYTGYLTLSGAVTGSADAAAIQVARSAMGALPVVGGIISNAAGTVLAGASTVKSAVGVAGMLAVLAICLLPFLRLLCQYLLYKLAAFLAGTIGPPPLVELIESLCGAFGMVLGMTGTCALLLLISIASAITVVT